MSFCWMFFFWVHSLLFKCHSNNCYGAAFLGVSARATLSRSQYSNFCEIWANHHFLTNSLSVCEYSHLCQNQIKQQWHAPTVTSTSMARVVSATVYNNDFRCVSKSNIVKVWILQFLWNMSHNHFLTNRQSVCEYSHLHQNQIKHQWHAPPVTSKSIARIVYGNDFRCVRKSNIVKVWILQFLWNMSQ